MKETTIERNMINIIEVICFKEAEVLVKELEIVFAEIEDILNRKYKKERANV